VQEDTGRIELSTKGAVMKARFMPGRAVYGTVAGTFYEVKKGNRKQQHAEPPVPLSDFLLGLLDKLFNKLVDMGTEELNRVSLAEARREYFEAHGYYPDGDPRDE